MDKDLLKDSKTFCLMPWLHLHTSPEGKSAPCCVSTSVQTLTGIGNSRTQSLMELINHEQMNKLRKDMLNGVKNDECVKCYQHEEQNVSSSRIMFNKEYADYFDEAIANTNEDGSLSNFKMRYFDVRFSNICNFKCRTCGSGFSTQWEQEDQKSKVWYARSVPKNDNPSFLEEIKDQVDNLKIAYFAGGEPLITEEHYVLLEEMIRRGATGVQLRYNTNISNLKFKDKDLLGLWSKFDLPIDIYASIDHYGERAEYIRHGTDWSQVETNLIQVKNTSFVKFQLNTVLSAFNYLTIKEFYQYLKDKNLYTPTDYAYLFHMTTPTYYSAHILPPEYKAIGRQNMETAIQFFSNNQYRSDQIEHLTNALNWVELCNTWDNEKTMFKSEIARLDELRGESFEKVFPELAGILTKE